MRLIAFAYLMFLSIVFAPIISECAYHYAHP